MTGDGDYWNSVGDEWRRLRPHAVWREFTDRQQAALLDRWLSDLLAPDSAATRKVLKTDLFDEVAARGLVGGLMARGVAVTGVDVAAVTVAEAAARNPGLVAVVADVRALPFADASFDAVFSGSTLDHFDTAAEIAVAIGEIARVLRPGGRLVLTLDNPDNPLVSLRNGPLSGVLRRLGIVPYQVGATLGRRPLADVLRSAGFEIHELTAVLHCPRVLAVALAGPAGRLGRSTTEVFQRSLGGWERLERWPTKWFTGHYVAVHASKPASSTASSTASGGGPSAS